ncbi:hypothetical protein VTN02DRAFT_3700 [Thermoascus thermophilus]
MCDSCGKYFENENNLRMHERSHEPADLECYGSSCYRNFASFSAMLIHLESGNCDSGTDCNEINDLAVTCFQHKKYSTDIADYYPYFCPCCSRQFRLLSGLYQHAETTPGCKYLLEQPYSLAKLEHFMACNL